MLLSEAIKVAVRMNTERRMGRSNEKKMVGRDLERYENCRCVREIGFGGGLRLGRRPPEETENRKRHARIHRVPYTGCAFDVCINHVVIM